MLMQIGALDPAGLPVAGTETAYKAVDRPLTSNALLKNWRSNEGKPM